MRSRFLGVVLLLVGVPTLAGAQNSGPKVALHVQPKTCKGTPCGTCAPRGLACEPSTSTVNTHGTLNTGYDVYTVVLDVETAQGLGGVEYGIYYDDAAMRGVDLFGWTSCSDLDFTGATWPAAGSGIVQTFNPCVGTTADPSDAGGEGSAVLGSLYVYAYSTDTLWITQRFDKNFEFRVSNCQAQMFNLDYISNAGFAGFGNAFGNDPCRGDIYDRFPGACCLPDGCQSLDPLYCEFLGGTYLGLVSCSECPTPVQSISWGRIKRLND